MKRLLIALITVVVLLGAGVGVLLGVFAGRGGGHVSREALAVGLYQEETAGGSWTCDEEIADPPAIDDLPAVVALIDAEDIGLLIEILNRNVAAEMLMSARSGRPYTDEKPALTEVEDGVLLYVALVRQGLGVSEDEARAYLENAPPGGCGEMTDDELVRGIQIGETTSRWIQQMIASAGGTGRGGLSMADLDQAIADMIAEARATVEITEVSFGEDRELVCTKDGAQVDCPSDLPTPEPTSAP